MRVWQEDIQHWALQGNISTWQGRYTDMDFSFVERRQGKNVDSEPFV